MVSLRILLVDDSADDAELILLALAGAGLSVTGHRVDTETAMRAALHDKTDWHLVISDFNMPSFSAFAALEVLQQTGRDIPFIVVSGFIGEESAVAILKAGAHDFVKKDNLARLAPAITRELREAENRRARRAADEALSRSEKRLRAITAALGEGVFVTDTEGILTFMNPAAEHLLGWSEAELSGQVVHDIIHRRDSASLPIRREECGHSMALDGAPLVRVEDDMFLRKDGTPMPVASVSAPILDGENIVAAVTAFQDITVRKRAAEELLESRRQLRALSAHLQTVREEERAHIARELHDELGQMLTALKFDVSWLRNRCPACAIAEVGDKLADMGELLDSTIAAARRISADLRPTMLDDLGLKAAVEWLVEEFAKRNAAIRCETRLELGDNLIHDNIATAAFRIVQECLTNASRHANASQMHVFVGVQDQQLHVGVRDNGHGLPARPGRKDSYGLIGMRERAEALGGTFRMHSAPGEGVSIEVTLPLAAGKEVG